MSDCSSSASLKCSGNDRGEDLQALMAQVRKLTVSIFMTRYFTDAMVEMCRGDDFVRFILGTFHRQTWQPFASVIRIPHTTIGLHRAIICLDLLSDIIVPSSRYVEKWQQSPRHIQSQYS